MKKYAFWSEADKRRLLELRGNGESNFAIAAAMGRTEDAARNLLYRMKISSRTRAEPWTDEEIATAQKLEALGYLPGVIAMHIPRHSEKAISAKLSDLRRVDAAAKRRDRKEAAAIPPEILIHAHSLPWRVDHSVGTSAGPEWWPR